MAPTDPKKCAIVVGNWFDDGWRPNARLAVSAIGRRWGVPVIELTQALGSDRCGMHQKLWLDQHCAAFDRVIWFDRDALVRYDCPNLFELVAEGSFGCVSSHQVPWHVRAQALELRALFEAHGVSYEHELDHLNTGIMVFEPREHAPIFKAARSIFEAHPGLPFFDEPPLSLAVKQSGQRQLLGATFNRCGLANLDEFQTEMTDYVWHFCGSKSEHVNGQIDATRWQLAPLPLWQPPVIAAWQEKRIIGFWHIGAMGDYSRIVAEQYQQLVDSGLYAASERILVGFIGGRHQEAKLPTGIRQDPKFEVFVTDTIEDYEYPTLAEVWRTAKLTITPFLCYYFHTKGASLTMPTKQAASNAWRRYMEYFNIEQWQDCVAVLNEYETCGVELQDQQSHYSGNFWWATSDYIRKLPNAYEYWAENKSNRLAAEYYLCLATPRAYCFNDFFENLYDFTVPPERYRK